jgi:hypothetical protein
MQGTGKSLVEVAGIGHEQDARHVVDRSKKPVSMLQHCVRDDQVGNVLGGSRNFEYLLIDGGDFGNAPPSAKVSPSPRSGF